MAKNNTLITNLHGEPFLTLDQAAEVSASPSKADKGTRKADGIQSRHKRNNVINKKQTSTSITPGTAKAKFSWIN